METWVCSGKKIKLKHEDCWIDQISRLPDELLVIILSCLSLKEAAASSILSRRWRFLWTFISKLDFEGSDLWTSYTSKPDFDIYGLPPPSIGKASHSKCWEYVGWVDKVLRLRDKSAALEEFRISFSLNKAHQIYLDRWIEFALAKISTVKIVNPLPALKRLTLICCYSLESVEVRNSNLEYFMYRGSARPLKHFLLKNVPLLVEMNVDMNAGLEKVEKFLSLFSSYLPQLEKLTIEKHDGMLSIMEADMICSSVKMSNLKQLVWKFAGFYMGECNLQGLTILVGALPLLQRLVIMSYGDRFKGNVDCFYDVKLNYRRAHTYSHLKQVEFVGYHGELLELAILLHFFEHAAALEEVIIHPAKGTFINYEIGEYTKQDIDAFRGFAKSQLTTRVPSTVTLKIL